MYKRISLLTAREGMDRSAFTDHWRNRHGPLIARLPGLRGYVQNEVLGEAGRNCGEAFSGNGSGFRADGVVELYFDSEEDMRSAFASPSGIPVNQDEREFLGTSSGYSVTGSNLPGDKPPVCKLIGIVGNNAAPGLVDAFAARLTGQDGVDRVEVHKVGSAFGKNMGPQGPQPAGYFVHVMGTGAMDTGRLAREFDALGQEDGSHVAKRVLCVREHRLK